MTCVAIQSWSCHGHGRRENPCGFLIVFFHCTVEAGAVRNVDSAIPQSQVTERFVFAGAGVGEIGVPVFTRSESFAFLLPDIVFFLHVFEQDRVCLGSSISVGGQFHFGIGV